MAQSIKGDDRRARILAYLRTCPTSATLREIGKAVGLSSSSTTWHHLDRLVKDGLVGSKGKGKNCGYYVVACAVQIAPETYRLKLATELCRKALDQLGDARTIVDALEVHDRLAELYDVLRGAM